ncbi:hypothetical protein Tco_0189121 [Tanacetum coccineum]
MIRRKVEMGRTLEWHRVYIDGGASQKSCYEHCFIKTPQSDKGIKWFRHTYFKDSAEGPFGRGQDSLVVKIRPGLKENRAVVHQQHTECCEISVEGGTRQRYRVVGFIPMGMVFTSSGQKKNKDSHRKENKVSKKRWKKVSGRGIMKEVHYTLASQTGGNGQTMHDRNLAECAIRTLRFLNNTQLPLSYVYIPGKEIDWEGGSSPFVWMSFDLKNAGSTYQRLVDKAFQKQIGRNFLEIKHEIEQRNAPFYCLEGMFLVTKKHNGLLRDVRKMLSAVLSLPSPNASRTFAEAKWKI